MKKPELLIPAGSLEVLKTAVNFGADAVYIGGEAFGLRAKAKNFSPEDMAEGVAYAHDRGVKVYVTANILAHNGDLEAASDYFMELKHLKTKDGRPVPPDALIISEASVPGDRAAHFHAGKQHELRDVAVLVESGRKACGFRTGAFPGRAEENPQPYSV